jgi:hypothetical protein
VATRGESLRHYPTDAWSESLRAHYRDADKANGGVQWYDDARALAQDIADDSDVTLKVASGVIAALSPRMQWVTNVNAARKACKGEAYGALGTSKRNADRILKGEDPLDVLRGPKTRAFYQAIMGDDDAAVLDTWMLQAVGLPGNASLSITKYNALSAALHQAADAEGVGTSTLQAVVWTHIRGKAT